MTIPVVEATQVFNVTSNATSTGAITLSLGTIATDDIILAIIALDGTGGNPTGVINQSPTTMTALQNTDEGNVEIEMLWIRVGATPPTTLTLSWTGAEQCRVMIMRISGALKGADIIDTIGTGLTNGATTTATPVSDASTEIDTLYIGAVAVDRDRVDSGDGIISGTGWSTLGTSGSSGGANGAGLVVGELDQAAIGNPADPGFGTWASDQIAAYVINIKSPPPATRSQVFIS